MRAQALMLFTAGLFQAAYAGRYSLAKFADFVYDCIMRGNCYYFCARNTIGGPKMSGNFVHCKRERNTLPLALAVHEISRHF